MTRRMGSAASQTPRHTAAVKKSRHIDRRLRDERMLQSIKIKLLILGTSESGKSTLAKQMRIIYHKGFSREDRQTYKHLIHWNLFRFMVSVVKTVEKHRLEYKGGRDVLAKATFLLKRVSFIETSEIELTADLTEAMKHVWLDETVQGCFRAGQVTEELVAAHLLQERITPNHLSPEVFCGTPLKVKKHHCVFCTHTEFSRLTSGEARIGCYSLLESDSFIEDIDRISALKYEPTDQDILRSRLQTSGVIQTEFKYKDYEISLIDVGGQKSERRKWIHCFDNVTSVLFTVAMGHYDLKGEESKVNRLRESFQVYCWVQQQKALQNCSIILLLNQKDVLLKKLPLSPFSVHFPSFSGLNTYDDVSGYIRNKFEKLSKNTDRELYSHFTNATDTSDTEFAMQACMASILSCHLRETAMW